MMISFACQDIEFKDLLRCSFELSKTEYNLMMFLLKTEKQYRAEDLGQMMKLDRTTVQKSIKKLADKDLVFRQQINLDKGGYTFEYTIKNKAEIKRRMEKIVENWYDEVLKEIRKW
jgi:predicted transcriptional regulator